MVTMTSTKAPYIDTNGKTDECSFRVFEIVNVTFISEEPVIPKLKLSKSMRTGLKLIVGKRTLAKKRLERRLQGIS